MICSKYQIMGKIMSSNRPFRLNQKFKVKMEGLSRRWITGCVILPNGHILIADYFGKKQLMEYNTKGKHVRDILLPLTPYGLTVIDPDHIAVCYGHCHYVNVVDIKNQDVERKMDLDNECWGISYQDSKLYVIVYKQGIVIMGLEGERLHTIKCDVSGVLHLTTTKDKIYYTDWINNTVNCCSMTGEQIWVLQDQSIVSPMGISVDTNQNVFVVGRSSNNLTLIQDGGKVRQTLLTESDGLREPGVVYFNKDRKELLIIGEFSGNVALYNF